MIGAFVALSLFSVKSKWFAEICAVSGLVAIGYSITQFAPSTAFPGFTALVPTLGSAAFIVANAHSLTYSGRILSLPYVVWFGLISYSLYLWHWPIFVFSDIFLADTNILQTLGLITISIVLSWFTYVFIETPFRKKILCSSRTIICVGLSVLAILACLGYSLKYIDVTTRVPLYAEKIVSESYKTGETFLRCQSGTCMLGSTEEDREPTFVFWGDSNASMLLEVVDRVAKKNDRRGMYFSHPACVPIEAVSASVPIENCQKINEEALAYIASHNIKNILLVSAWSMYVQQHPDDNLINLIVDADSREVSVTNSERVFKRHIVEMLERMRNEQRSVFILRQIPRQENFDLRGVFYDSIRNGAVIPFETESLSAYHTYTAFIDATFDALEKEGDVVILDPEDILCSDTSQCIAFTEGQIIYEDPGHLNAVGARMLEPLVQRFMNGPKQ